MCVSCSTAATADHDGPTLEDKLAKSDPEFLQFLKDEGSNDMLGWTADDLGASSSDEADNDNSTFQSSASVNTFLQLSYMWFWFDLYNMLVY